MEVDYSGLLTAEGVAALGALVLPSRVGAEVTAARSDGCAARPDGPGYRVLCASSAAGSSTDGVAARASGPCAALVFGDRKAIIAEVAADSA